jgi:hypothetical protein
VCDLQRCRAKAGAVSACTLCGSCRPARPLWARSVWITFASPCEGGGALYPSSCRIDSIRNLHRSTGVDSISRSTDYLSIKGVWLRRCVFCPTHDPCSTFLCPARSVRPKATSTNTQSKLRPSLQLLSDGLLLSSQVVPCIKAVSVMWWVGLKRAVHTSTGTNSLAMPCLEIIAESLSFFFRHI